MASGSVNKVILIGRLGANPELRYTSGGAPVANFRMATNEAWNDKQGQRQERTEWHRIVAWGKLGEICGEHLTKGRQVYIEGKIQTRQWDDRDGNKRYTTEILAREITFLDSRSTADASRGSSDVNMGMDNNSDGFDYGPPPLDDDNVPF